MVYGARPSILVGVLTTIGAVLLGGTVGALAGFYGGLTDSLMSRVTDVFFAIPLLLGAIVFLSAIEARNVFTVVLALVVLGWTQIARIMRGAVISVKEADFVLAAAALGRSNRRILVRHILPNALAPGHRRGDHLAGHLHRGGGDAVVPRHRPAAQHRVLGRRHQHRAELAAQRAADPARAGCGAQPDRPVFHPARRRRAGGARPAAAMSSPRTALLLLGKDPLAS
jgi:hypothetical protein